MITEKLKSNSSLQNKIILSSFNHLLTLKLFKICMNVFLLLNTKEDILKNVGNQKVYGPYWLV